MMTASLPNVLRLLFLAWGVAAATNATPAQLRSAELAFDVNRTAPIDPGAEPAELTTIGGAHYFAATTAVEGNELFVLPVGGATPQLAVDNLPGSQGSRPRQLRAVGPLLFYVATGPDVGRELHVLDTRTGLHSLVVDVHPGVTSSNPEIVASIGSVLYFTAYHPMFGAELWRTDGVPGQARMVLDIWPGTGSGAASNGGPQAIALGNQLIFRGDDGVHGNELWISDGTAAGTRMLVDIDPGPLAGSFPLDFAEIQGRVVFAARTILGGDAVWATDGTAAGTQPIAALRVCTNCSLRREVRLGGYLYFTADAHQRGVELHRTDGTAQGTTLVIDLYPGNGSSDIVPLAVSPTHMLFAGSDDGFGREPYLSDGTAAGTQRIADLWPGRMASITLDQAIYRGGQFWFLANDGSSGSEVWTVSPTTPLTRVTDFAAGALGPVGSGFWPDGAADLLFAADDGAIGAELWRLDVAAATASLASNVNALPSGASLSSHPQQLFDHHGQLYFTADDGVHGAELWRHDGTTARLVADIVPGPTGAVIGDFASLGRSVLFTEATSFSRKSLWVTDGTAAGTVGLFGPLLGAYIPGSPFAAQIQELGDLAVFVAASAATGEELWVTDGTPMGTRLMFETLPGTATLEPTDFVPFRGGLAFRTRIDGGLWWTNGTAAGTAQVALSVRVLTPPVVFGDRLYFQAGFQTGGELWSSDLTTSGTKLLVDINPSTAARPHNLVPTPDGLFFVADDGTHGNELWSTNGTAAGTRLVGDLTPGSGDSTIAAMHAFGDGVIFAVSRVPHVASVLAARALPARVHGTRVAMLVTSPGRAYFGGFGSSFLEHEPWTSDGTAAGTFEHTLLRSGEGGSDPGEFTLSGGTVYFVADNGVYGRELWKLDPGASVQTAGASCGVGEVSLATSSAVLGQPIRIELTSTVGSMATLYLGLPSLPLRLTGACSLFLDPSSVAVVGTYALSSSGSFGLAVPIPRDNALRGLYLAVQAEVGPSPAAPGVEVSPVARFTIGN